MLVTNMKRVLIKIGGSMDKDMRDILEGKARPKPGTHTIYLKSANELYELLSPKKIELLRTILTYPDSLKSVNEVSKATKRKQEAISRDLRILTKHGLVEKIKDGRTARLRARYGSLEISLAK